MSVLRTFVLLFACTVFSGCATQIYGKQSSSGGVTATTTSTAVRGSASFSHGRASVSWGQPVSPAAKGGQVTLSKDATGVLILGIVIADLVRQMDVAPTVLDWLGLPKLAQAEGASLAPLAAGAAAGSPGPLVAIAEPEPDTFAAEFLPG